jgi:hypothetical protein
MKATWWLGVILVAGSACVAPSGGVSGGSSKPHALEVRIQVSGDVQTALVDARGQRTGWYGGWIEDIPNCRLEAMRDEVVEPHDYTFHLRGAGSQSYRLLVTPRTEGHLSIALEGTLAGKLACVAQADTELVAGESEWLLRWSTATGDKCRMSITPILRSDR